MDTHFNSHLSIFQWYGGHEVYWSRNQEIMRSIGWETRRPRLNDVINFIGGRNQKPGDLLKKEIRRH